MERIDSLCEGYIDFFWDILTFKPVRDLLQTSPRTRSWMEQGVTVFQGVTDSVMENSVGQWIKNHQKLVKVAVAAAACGLGLLSLVSHPPTENLIELAVLVSAACLPVAEHYSHKSNTSPLTQKDQCFKTTASVLHVLADTFTIGASLFSAVLQAIQSQSATHLIEAVKHPLVDKLGDMLAVAGAQGLTKRDTFYGVAAKVTTSVLTVAALHNVVAAVVPTVSGVYLTVYALWACFKAGQCLLSTNKGARFAATAAAAASVWLGVVPPSLTPTERAGSPVPTPVTSPPPTHTVTIPEGGTLWEAVEKSGTCPKQNPKQDTQDICIANVIKTLADNGADNVNLVYPGETLRFTKTPVGSLVSFRRATALVQPVHER